jgi:hypothetical protein
MSRHAHLTCLSRHVVASGGHINVLLLDSISTGLDSAATFDIVTTLHACTRSMHANIVACLLQPPPEVYLVYRPSTRSSKDLEGPTSPHLSPTPFLHPSHLTPFTRQQVFELFDDVMVMDAGQVVYHGPRQGVLQHFESLGLRCPPRKDVADFLVEVQPLHKPRRASNG